MKESTFSKTPPRTVSQGTDFPRALALGGQIMRAKATCVHLRKGLWNMRPAVVRGER